MEAENKWDFPARGPDVNAAHEALKAWCETDEGRAAVAAVGGVLKSNPLYLAYIAGYQAALKAEISP